MKPKAKTYHLLLIAGLVYLLASFFAFSQGRTVDIHLHDTYYIVSFTQLLWLLATFAVFSWIVYTITDKLLYSRVLIWIHVAVTLLLLTLLTWITYYGTDDTASVNQLSVQDSRPGFDTYAEYSAATAIIVFWLLIVQIIFIINILPGVFKRKTQPKM